jgi:hypothetical protein
MTGGHVFPGSERFLPWYVFVLGHLNGMIRKSTHQTDDSARRNRKNKTHFCHRVTRCGRFPCPYTLSRVSTWAMSCRHADVVTPRAPVESS